MKEQYSAEDWSNGHREGYIEGMQYAIEYLTEVYGLEDDIQETNIWTEAFGDEEDED